MVLNSGLRPCCNSFARRSVQRTRPLTFDSRCPGCVLVLDQSLASTAPMVKHYPHLCTILPRGGSWTPWNGSWSLIHAPCGVPSGQREPHDHSHLPNKLAQTLGSPLHHSRTITGRHTSIGSQKSVGNAEACPAAGSCNLAKGICECAGFPRRCSSRHCHSRRNLVSR